MICHNLFSNKALEVHDQVVGPRFKHLWRVFSRATVDVSQEQIEGVGDPLLSVSLLVLACIL